MASLVMGIRSFDGVVLASDARYDRIGEDSPNIHRLGDQIVALVEPHVDVGQRILQEAVGEQEDELELQVLAERCSELAVEHREEGQVPGTGLILAGIDEENVGPIPPSPQLISIHHSRNYQLAQFGGNVFGGNNSIARYISAKLADRTQSLSTAKSFAALAVLLSAKATPQRIDPFAAMATLTFQNGFQWVGRDELSELMEAASREVIRLRSELTEMFLDSPGVHPHTQGEAESQ